MPAREPARRSWSGWRSRPCCSLIYVVSNPSRTSYYNHFVWQAEAFLDGRAAIRYPVYDGPDGRGNNLFQDVVLTTGPNGETTGYALLPFPPLPAVVLMPFVAVWGLATDAQLVAALLGAVDVAIACWVLGRLPIGPRVRIATRCSSGSGRCSGTRPSSGPPGTWPTSWRWA